MKKVVKWTFVVLLAVGVVYTFFFLWKRQQPEQVKYETICVERRDIEKRTIVTGKIEPRDEVAIKAQISGIVAELYKEAGQQVKSGEAIAKIKVVPDMAQLSTAESRLRIAENDLTNKAQIFQRDSVLYIKKVISQEDYDKSYLQIVQAREELKAAKDNLSIVKEGVAASSKNAGNTIVRSTISGTILDIPVKIGNSVINVNTMNDGTTIATVADMSDMLFIGKIDETEVGKLCEGMTMDLIVGALNDQCFYAVLEYISPKGTESNGAMMFEIKGAAHIPDSVRIRSGYSANAEIILSSRKDVLALSEAAVHITSDSTYVELITDTVSQSVVPQQVVIGLSDGIKVEILSGLKEGDMVRGNPISNKPM